MEGWGHGSRGREPALKVQGLSSNLVPPKPPKQKMRTIKMAEFSHKRQNVK
jgi:hypothetical protein